MRREEWNRIRDAGKYYDAIQIPEELDEVVRRAVASVKSDQGGAEEPEAKSGWKEQGKKMEQTEKMGMTEKMEKTDKKEKAGESKKAGKNEIPEKKQKRLGGRICRYAVAAAAALLLILGIGANTSEVFAKEMGQLPVLGKLVQVLTIRSWHGTDGDYEMNLEIPQIADDGNSDEVNAEIQEIVDAYMAQAKEEFAEYKEAFFATGGTEEEWGGRTMDIYVDYDVTYQEGDILSFVLVTAKDWVSAEEERHYYNLNLAEKRALTLQELLGDDYIDLCNKSITEQIEQRIQNDENAMYFGFGDLADTEGFTTVTPETMFYLNGDGKVVIVFGEYEIAPGSMGFPEFVIG